MDGEAASYLPYASLLVVVVGWFVANAQANTREERKEARAVIDSARERIDAITENYLQYRCHGKLELATVITASLDVLEVDLGRIKNFGVRGGPLIGRLVQFQDAVTGGDFESRQPQQVAVNDTLVKSVLLSRNLLLQELERQFRAYYC